MEDFNRIRNILAVALAVLDEAYVRRKDGHNVRTWPDAPICLSGVEGCTQRRISKLESEDCGALHETLSFELICSSLPMHVKIILLPSIPCPSCL